jgi:hypothetical protein
LVRALPVTLAVVLIVSLAVVQGRLSDRWTASKFDAEPITRRLESLPMKIDEWQGKDEESDPSQLKGAGALSHLTRLYHNTRTGQNVSLFVVAGHSRDISVHTPDRCYRAAGWTQMGPQITHTLPLGETNAEFYTATFRKEEPEGTQTLRVYWTWGHDGSWTAPQYPRLAFPSLEGLYKLYLIAPVTGDRDTPTEGPCLDFGRLVMPEVSKALFPN